MLKEKGRKTDAKIIKFPVRHKPLYDILSLDRETRQVLRDSKKLEARSNELLRFAEETLKKVVGN